MIWVIEPHSDDAFISLGGHIEKWRAEDRAVTIVTVYGSEHNRAEEAREYCRAVGATSLVLDYEQGEPVTNLGVQLSLVSVGDTYIYFPMGIQHADHIRVANHTMIGVSRYLEIPYYTKLKNQQEVQDKSWGWRVESVFTPNRRKWRHIGIYKSQSKFFHFNQDIHFPEIVLCK